MSSWLPPPPPSRPDPAPFVPSTPPAPHPLVPPLPARPANTARRVAARDGRADKDGPDGAAVECVAGYVVAAGSHGGAGSGSGDSGREGGEDRGSPTAPEPLEPCLRHVGDTIAMVCRFEQAQCVWSARIPLDAELLAGTVLHLSYSPALLAVRFETSDWEARDLLRTQLGALEALVAGLLGPGCAVVVTL